MLLTPEEREATVMFYDTCEDVDGDKVPRPMMKRLAELGLVVRLKGRWYIGTPAGKQVHAEFVREEMRRYEKGKHIQHFLGWLMILNQEQFSAVMVESGCGAVEVGLVCLLPPLSFGGALVPLP